MQALLWLLLPVAAVSGWLLARRVQNTALRRSGNTVPPAYFRGLNYLLNEQPDKAIEVFIQILEVDSETVETHLALGNLFRRRGEVDRAIRIHQNLIARPTLEGAQRAEALLELGQDYMRAGLFDRAENIFQELIRLREHTGAARRHLLDIYQQEKDWENAVEVVRQLDGMTEAERRLLIGQFYCELADQALEESDQRRARQMVRRALAGDPKCVRASILLGRMEVELGDQRNAIRAYRRVEQQDPRYLPEIIDPLFQCYSQMGDRPGFVEFLQQVLRKYQGISVILALAEQIRQSEGEAAASAFVVEQLRNKPSVRGLDWLIEINLEHTEGRAKDSLLVLKHMTGELLEQKPVYKCSYCGFAGKALHWRCPGCKSWNSIRQIQGVEGE